MKSEQTMTKAKRAMMLALVGITASLGIGWCWSDGLGLCLSANYPISMETLPCGGESTRTVQQGEFTEQDIMMPEAVKSMKGKAQKLFITLDYEDGWTYLLVAVPADCTNYIIPHYRQLRFWCQGATAPDPWSPDCEMVDALSPTTGEPEC